ncbi:MAG: hypothetical protein AAF499_09085 [Pseudomonadota bacterium]
MSNNTVRLLLVGVICTSLYACGSSSSNDVSDGGDLPQPPHSRITTLASAPANSDPTQFDALTLTAELAAIVGSGNNGDPVPLLADDTASTVLNRISN